jgi:hypothetical protein
MALLSDPHVETTEKHIACDLLCCIYLENDLVFALRPPVFEDRCLLPPTQVMRIHPLN